MTPPLTRAETVKRLEDDLRDGPDAVTPHELESAIHHMTATCAWAEDEDGVWHSDCGEAWEFISDGPAQNNARFCHGCGLTIAPVKFPPPPDDESREETP